MMDITVIQGQSVADIAVQYSGNIEAMFEVAANNSLRLDDGLAAGSTLKVNDVPLDKNVRNIYVNDEVKVATDDGVLAPGGIGSWHIWGTGRPVIPFFIIQ